MTIQPPATLYGIGIGSRSENVEIPIVAQTNPGIYFVPGLPIGKRWINSAANTVYVLTSVVTSAGVTTPTWTLMESASGALNTLTGDTGTATPSSNNIKIAGTTSQITTAASGSTVTLTIPSAFIAPGSIASTTTVTSGTAMVATTSLTAGTTITSTLGAITATNGNLVMGTAGNKIIVPTGSNASAGTSGVMSGTPGVVTVATTACSTTAKVFYCRNVVGGTPGQVSITAQDATGFTLTSTGNESSTFNWWIINA